MTKAQKITKELPAAAQVDTKLLTEAFNGDLDLMLFYVTWVKNGLNAGKAYHELHPQVDEHSARTLGSRLLTKVDRSLVMQAYSLDHQEYFEQIKAGHAATKWNDFTGEREADHAVRLKYNDKIGRLLGVENDAAPQVNVQVNNVIAKQKEGYGL
jgi:hypothetical protein